MYRHTIVLEVLSEEPLPKVTDLSWIAYQMEQGDYVGNWTAEGTVKLSDDEMKESLYRLGSEPSFFFPEGE